jgi:hypothetical protein
VSGASGYVIQVSTSPLFSAFVLNVTTGPALSQYTAVTNLPALKALYWRVRANGLNGPSAWSASANFVANTVANTATPTLTPTPTFTSTLTETPTPTATPTDTATPTATSTQTFTPVPSATATLTPTRTNTVTPTHTQALTAGPTNTSTATPTLTLTPTNTPGNASIWIELAPVGSPPNPVYSPKQVSYDAAHNLLIAFFPGHPPYNGNPPGNGNEVWILTNANGLGGTPVWTKLEPTGTAPISNGTESVAYDAVTNRLVVYGGCYANCSPALSDVFVLANANGLGGMPAWSQLNVTNPQARADNHSAVFDTANNLMVTFGGALAFFGTDKNDTRILSNANGLTGPSVWTTLSTSGALPGTREGHSAIYDQANNRMTLFGGVEARSCCYNFIEYNDLWVLANANGNGGTPTWVQQAPLGNLPSPRYGHSAVYDSTNNRMFVFGGVNLDEVTQTETKSGDLWELDNANGLGGTPAWKELSQTGPAPGPRSGHTAAFDLANQRMIVLGGRDQADTTSNRVWVLAWGAVTPALTPAPTATSTATSIPVSTATGTPTLTPTPGPSETNIALNPGRTGYPHPLESDSGWGGGSSPWDMLDGKTAYTDTWAHGLAFTGGTGSWAGQSCGWRQATVNFGTPQTFNRVLVWHHGEDHIPTTYVVEYWDSANWLPVGGTSTVRYDLRSDTTTWGAIPTETIFPAVTGSKVRLRLNNCNITHGWIYQFDVFAGAPGPVTLTPTPTPTHTPVAPTLTNTPTPTPTAVPCFTLNVNSASGGSVSANPAPNCAGGRYISGSEVQLTYATNSGYIFDNWSGDAGGASNPVAVTMLGDRSVTANFSACYTLDIGVNPITMQPPGAGSININPTSTCGGQNLLYRQGTQVTVTASANSGYVFDYWTGDCAGQGNTCSLIMNGSKSSVANFARLYTLTLTSSVLGGASGTSQVKHGVPTNIGTAAIITGSGSCQFVQWQVVSGTASIANPSANATTATLTNGDAAIRALYACHN